MTAFTIQTVPLSAISTDGYQRDRIDSHVERIVDTFDPSQWDLPKLTDKGDGTFRVIAGQHRVEAARRLVDMGAWPFGTTPGEIEAQVISGIDDTRGEALLFMADARNKKALSPFDKHRASLVAEDRQALEVQAALDKLGLQLVRRQRTKSGQTIAAVTALYRLWDRGHGGRPAGDTLVYETLRLASLWNADDIFRFDGLLLGGLGSVAQEHLNLTGKVTRLEKLVRKVPAYTLATLAQKWSVEHGGVFSNTPMPYANVIRERL